MLVKRGRLGEISEMPLQPFPGSSVDGMYAKVITPRPNKKNSYETPAFYQNFMKMKHDHVKVELNLTNLMEPWRVGVPPPRVFNPNCTY
jgi:hypothetical protein